MEKERKALIKYRNREMRTYKGPVALHVCVTYPKGKHSPLLISGLLLFLFGGAMVV